MAFGGELLAGRRTMGRVKPWLAALFGLTLCALVEAGRAEQPAITITPGEKLPNGTIYVIKHSDVSFNCSTTSQQKSNISWSFSRDSMQQTCKTVEGTFAEFTLSNVGSDKQGNYTCSTNYNVTKEVLVYYPPEGPPLCHAGSSDHSVHLLCSWTDGYPHPTFVWSNKTWKYKASDQVHGQPGLNDSMVLQIKGSDLHDGQIFKCVGHHIAYEQKMEPSCSLILKVPLPESKPLVYGIEGSNTTLICHSKEGNPLPKLTWLRNDDVEIFTNSKYIVLQEAVTSFLTIQQSSKALDEGRYVCKSENPLGIKEVEIWVSFNNKNISGLVGAIAILVLLIIAAVCGIFLYKNRNLLNTRRHFWQTGSNVFTLVDSEEDDYLADEGSSGITSVVNHQPVQSINGHAFVEGNQQKTHNDQLPNEGRNESDA
ncbi:V-set and immunoglobulin domain-containing protein 10 [Hemitrygon akajei]|uniref:V-set and immunoglobulin domain-containing protein 10 n=1 Tax=Hemitrygon akajei TaxID=2704970 RepID=UPI003BF99C25